MGNCPWIVVIPPHGPHISLLAIGILSQPEIQRHDSLISPLLFSNVTIPSCFWHNHRRKRGMPACCHSRWVTQWHPFLFFSLNSRLLPNKLFISLHHLLRFIFQEKILTPLPAKMDSLDIVNQISLVGKDTPNDPHTNIYESNMVISLVGVHQWLVTHGLWPPAQIWPHCLRWAISPTTLPLHSSFPCRPSYSLWSMPWPWASLSFLS